MQAVSIWAASVVVLDLLDMKGNSKELMQSTLTALIGIVYVSAEVVKNFIAGTVLLIFRPFKVGDRIKVGDTEADVEQIHLLDTVVRSWDNVVTRIPSINLLSSQLIIRTRQSWRNVEVQVFVPSWVGVEETEAALKPVMDKWEAKSREALEEFSKSQAQLKEQLSSVFKAVDLDGDGILTLSDVWIMIAEFWPLSLLLSAKNKGAGGKAGDGGGGEGAHVAHGVCRED